MLQFLEVNKLNLRFFFLFLRILTGQRKAMVYLATVIWQVPVPVLPVVPGILLPDLDNNNNDRQTQSQVMWAPLLS